jgi:hypothetical protein
MKKTVLIFLTLIFFVACQKNDLTFTPDFPIAYPVTGHYGDNILDESTTQFYLSPHYSLYAILPQDKSIKIIMDNTSPNVSSDGWFYTLGSNVNLVVSMYDETTGIQIFESTLGAEEIDLNMHFGGSGSAIINIYEDGSEEVTRTKNIIW